MPLEKTDSFHFVEELVATVLQQSGQTYIPLEMCSSDLEFAHWTEIVTSIAQISENIERRYKTHVVSVCESLETNEDYEFYVNLLGEFTFEIEIFSWSLFRMFLAMILELAVFAFKDLDVQLPDGLIIFTAKYIESKLHDSIQQLGGWKAFEKDCVKTVLKQQQLEINAKVDQYKMNRKKRLLSRTSNPYPCGIITYKPRIAYPKMPKGDFIHEKVVLERNPGFLPAGSSCYTKQLPYYGSSSQQSNSLILESVFKEVLDLASYVVRLSFAVFNEL